jgi:aminoglycoside phosphotransferase (APT) family kinase protein
MPYHLPANVRDGLGETPEAGIPAEAEYVAAYCRRTGRAAIGNWPFYVAFALFRMASIAEGVYARGLRGNAAAGNALTLGEHVPLMARAALRLIES